MGLCGGLRMICYAITAHKRGMDAPCHGLSTGTSPISLAWNAKEALMKRIPMTLAALMLAAPAFALEPINQEKRINDTLRSGFIADQIADNCPTIEPRKLRALNELLKLRDYALSQGYSASEVRAFVESKTEKARGKAEAAAWLAAKGAVPGQTEAYCAAGEAEIVQGSLTGRLLRSTK